ncbi:MAG: DUF6484 domain-containing protein [Planctomycetota bacterium]
MKTDTPRPRTIAQRTRTLDAALPSIVRGAVVGVEAGRPVVAWGEGASEVADCVHMENAVDWTRCAGLSVFLAFEDGDARRPVVVGFQEPPPRAATPVPDVTRMRSGEEMVLECGKAKIALRADGRIEIRGGHLISRSSGPNKIQGGSVHIN